MNYQLIILIILGMILIFFLFSEQLDIDLNYYIIALKKSRAIKQYFLGNKYLLFKMHRRYGYEMNFTTNSLMKNSYFKAASVKEKIMFLEDSIKYTKSEIEKSYIASNILSEFLKRLDGETIE